MGIVNQFELSPLQSTQSGEIEFFTPQASHQTLIVQVPPNTQEDLFVHRFQTDQLVVVKGSLVIVLLQNRKYHYVLLSDRHPQVLTIPPGLLHGAINLSTEPCLVINAVLRHGDPCARDYLPLKPPLPYDLKEVRKQLMTLEVPAGV